MVNKVENLTVEQIKKGGDELFSDLYLQHRELFMNYAKRYIQQEDLVQDIYQDSFMIFYRNVMDGRLSKLTSKISTYLISIGKNKIFEHLRKTKNIVKNDLALEFAQDSVGQVDALEWGETNLSAEQQLLHKYFKELGESCQAILTNFYYHGFTISEIKEIGNYNSENVVKAQKSRCLKQLRELINKTK